MNKILVTGGAGFIGANFVHYWLEQYPQDRVIVLDALTYAGNLANLEAVKALPRLRFVHGNICDQNLVENLLTVEKIDTIVNFAAESHVDRSILGPDPFIETNVIGTHNLLKAAKKIWIDTLDLDAHAAGLGPHKHRFHHVSTDEVYGSLEPNAPAFTETSPYAPNSPYAASKAASDHLVRAYHHTYGLETTISNCSNNYGPFQFPEKLIPLIIINILHGKPLPIYGDGLNVRDWLYVEDHCRGIDLVLKKGKPGEVYNIGGNNEQKNIEIVKRICRMVDDRLIKDPELKKRFPKSPINQGQMAENLISFVKDRPGHDRRYAINATKIRKKLGYEPKESFESGIEKTIQWYLENEEWWQLVMDGSYQEWISRQYSY